MTNQTAVAPDTGEEVRWRAWQARGAANDRRTASRMRSLMRLVVTALTAWLLLQLI
jgi:hypothetical protein